MNNIEVLRNELHRLLDKGNSRDILRLSRQLDHEILKVVRKQRKIKNTKNIIK